MHEVIEDSGTQIAIDVAAHIKKTVLLRGAASERLQFLFGQIVSHFCGQRQQFLRGLALLGALFDAVGYIIEIHSFPYLTHDLS